MLLGRDKLAKGGEKLFPSREQSTGKKEETSELSLG